MSFPQGEGLEGEGTSSGYGEASIGAFAREIIPNSSERFRERSQKKPPGSRGPGGSSTAVAVAGYWADSTLSSTRRLISRLLSLMFGTRGRLSP